MIKFEQINEACIREYTNYIIGVGESSGRYNEILRKHAKEEFSGDECLDDLLNTLDGLGFSGREGMQFIFDSIIEE